MIEFTDSDECRACNWEADITCFDCDLCPVHCTCSHNLIDPPKSTDLPSGSPTTTPKEDV